MASIHQVVCEPCSRGDTVSNGYSWCSDCVEILCAVCDKAHRVGKLTMSHHVTEIHDLPVIPKETIVKLRFCDIHPEKIIDFYCSFHDVVGCQTCILQNHRACEKIELIDDVSSGIKSSVIVEDVSKAVSALLRTFDSVLANRKNNKDLIHSQDTMFKTSIDRLKQCLLQHVDSLEQSLLSDLAKQKDETLSKLDAQIAEASEMNEHMQNIKKDLDFIIKHGSNSQLFRLVEKSKNEISEVEARLQDNLIKTKNVALEYTVTEDLSNIILALASITKRDQPCDIEHISQLQKKAQFVPAVLSLTFNNPLYLALHETGSISGIEVTSDNVLLLCSYFASTILQYKDDTFIQKKDLDDRPYQIKIMPNYKQAAVTMPLKSGILIIDAVSLLTIREINTEKKYFAIEIFNNAFIVGGDRVLDMITMDGKVNRTIEVPENGTIRYIIKRRDDTILYTNFFKLYCIHLFDGTRAFEYNMTKEARGIAEDKYGCIYVADKLNKKIHRLAPDGSLIDTIANGNEEGIGSPLALRFNPDYSKLYVGLDENKMLLVYKCK